MRQSMYPMSPKGFKYPLSFYLCLPNRRYYYSVFTNLLHFVLLNPFFLLVFQSLPVPSSFLGLSLILQQQQGEMERFCAHPTPTSYLSPTLFPSSSSSLSIWAERGRDVNSFGVSSLLGKFISAIFTILFALVGSLIGAMTGAFVGQATESGFFRGAAIGAISGAVFSIEVFESSLVLWRSDESGIWSLLYMIDIISSLLSGRLVREQVGPVMFSAVQTQMNAVERIAEEVPDIFATGGTKGLSVDSVEMLPKIKITTENNVDTSGEWICCSVCLQDFQVGETVRRLPPCEHMFHLPCIDNWLIRHGSCPLCRRDL